MHLTSKLRLAAVAASMIGAACGGNDPEVPVTPTGTLAVVSGDSQRVVVGGNTTAPLVAKLTDAAGNPMAGVTVAWSIPVGIGTLAASSGVTSSAGTVSNTFTSQEASGTAKVDAGLGTSLARFTVIVAPGPATAFSIGSGNNTAVQVGHGIPLTVRLLDSRGNGVAGVTVTWTKTGGALRDVTSVTDETGTASNLLTPTAAGRITVGAATAGFPSLTFTVDGV